MVKNSPEFGVSPAWIPILPLSFTGCVIQGEPLDFSELCAFARGMSGHLLLCVCEEWIRRYCHAKHSARRSLGTP